MMKKNILVLSLILGTASLATASANAAGPLSESGFKTALENIARNQAEQRAYVRDYVKATEDYNRDSKIRSIVRNINARQAEQRAYIQDYVKATEDYNREARVESVVRQIQANQARQRAKISEIVAQRSGNDEQMADRLSPWIVQTKAN